MAHPKLTLKNGVITGSGKISMYGDIEDVRSGGDNGVGASGYRHVDNPYAPYCSLPIEYWEEFNLQPFQEVTVEYEGRQVECFLDDKGPGGTPEADERLVDTCPSVHKRLRCTTDSIVEIFIPLGRIVPLKKRC